MLEAAEVAIGTPAATEATPPQSTSPAPAPVASPAPAPAPEKLSLRDSIKKQVRESSKQTEKPAATSVAAPITAPAPAPEPTKRLAPKSWKIESPDDENLFFTLPDKVRERWEKRDGDYEKGIGKYRADAEWAENIRKNIAQFEPYLQQTGMRLEQAIPSLLNAEMTLRTGAPAQKIAAFRHLMQQYGVDESSLYPQQSGTEVAQDQNQGYTDPNIAHLINEVHGLRQYVQQSQYQTHQQTVSSAQSEIEKFASNPANKHFDKVKEDMGKLIGAGLASTLDDAYQMAIYQNQEVRDFVIKEQIAAREESMRKEQQELKAKAVSLTGAPPATSAPSPKGLRDFIREQIRNSSQPARV